MTLELYLALCGLSFVVGMGHLIADTHRVRRWWCRRVGHLPHNEERARPVTAFRLCLRCGKILERLP